MTHRSPASQTPVRLWEKLLWKPFYGMRRARMIANGSHRFTSIKSFMIILITFCGEMDGYVDKGKAPVVFFNLDFSSVFDKVSHNILRVKLQKLKEEREAKRARLDGRHDYLLDTVASCVNLDKAEVEDAILDGNQIERIDRFLATGGLRHLMFCYQDVEITDTEHVGLPGTGTNSHLIKKKLKVFVTEGKEVALTGVCIFFIRSSLSKPITTENIYQEVNFNMMNIGRDGLLKSVEQLISEIFIPALQTADRGWVELGEPQQVSIIRQDFLHALEAFVNVLSGTQQSLLEKVNLKKCETYDLRTLRGPSDYLMVANSIDALEKIEVCMKGWTKQIEQVLAENDQVRKEADDLGPRAELDYWKKKLSKFNYLMEQLKSPDVKAVLGVLTAAKSKLLKKWRALDIRITEAANEAKDNVKYLYSLEKYYDPLYNSDPVSMVDAIPGLINTIKLIQSISQYYNTSEKISSLFVKVTNQMITACKSYIANNGTATIWNQPQERVMEKLQAAIRLKQEYQNCFRKIKENLEQNPAERQFDFSEMYIFGKFETFHRRLVKIIDVFNTMKTYSVLQESKIEGLEEMITKYESIVDNIKNKHYNFLDQRKTDFDQDYEEFCREINDLHDQLRIFMDITLESILNTERALSMLQKFERLQIPNLGIDEKYQKIFQKYGHDIETVGKIYSRHKQDPPLARNLPPIAGKILWARHLFHRIQEPLKTFQRHPAVLQTPDGKHIIRNYNKVAKVLMKFEVIYHREWLQQINNIQLYRPDWIPIISDLSETLGYSNLKESLVNSSQIELTKRGLQATLLVKAPETGELLVNFDPQILTLIRETDCMVHMCLEIPPFASVIQHQRDWYKKIVNNLHVMLAEYKRIKMKIQHPIEQLMVPRLANVDDAIQPGLMLLTWTSLNIEKYINTVFNKLAGLELLLDRVNDLVEFRIDAVLQEMNSVPLCKLPEEEPLSCEEFLQKTKELCVKGSQTLHLKSSLVEAAANDLINMLLDTEVQVSKEDEKSVVPSGEKRLKNTGKRKRTDFEKLEEEANELLSYFNNRNVDALLKVIRNTLETLRKRIHASSMTNFLENHSASKQRKRARPMIRTSINLSIPNIIMTPSLDEVQQTLNKAVNSIVKVMKGVGQWSKERRSKKKMLERKVAVLQCESRDSDSDEEMKETGKNPIHDSVSDAASLSSSDAVQSQNYFKSVSENKEIIKLVSLLSSAISSTKREILTALESFSCYHHIWQRDKEETIDKLMMGNPLLTEFESEILHFQDLDLKINSEPEYICVGAIAMYTADLKLALRSETKTWMTLLGYHCNKKYRTEMEAILTFIEETGKKLNRNITDLDDIRIAMSALKEIRELQISIESQVGPIENGPLVVGLKPREASDRLTMFQNRFDNLFRKYITCTGGEDLFGLPVTQYPELLEIQKQLNMLQKLYKLYNSVIDTISGYYDILWSELDIEKINSELLEFQNRCRKLPRAVKEWQAFLDLKKTIEDFSECCPLLERMSNKVMMPRHWKQIADLTEHRFDVESETFKLRDIMEAPLLRYKEDIEDICISAVKERDIEQKLKQVISEWDNKTFIFSNFKTRGELLLRGDSTSETIATMEDSLMILGSLMNNRYNTPFKTQIQKWVHYLSNTTVIIENWLTVQNLWLYLEAVFVGGDIAKQLPKEAKRFSNIDKSWVRIMTRAHETPNVVQCCVGDEIMGQLLPHLLEQLEICQKSLTGYLEKKRLLFPRFFFVSDPALLEILGQASDSHNIQAHLLNVFDNIKTVRFHEKIYDRILSISSQEGETVELTRPVMAEGSVEVWLSSLLKESQVSLHHVIRQAALDIQETDFQITEFLSTYPAQVGLLGIQMIWTRDSEEALTNAKHDKKVMQKTNQFFLDLLNMLIDMTTKDLSPVERIKYETLITIHVHQRDIFDGLCCMRIKSPTDFEWLKQCRFYFKEDSDKMLIKITDVSFTYQNEFLGCTDRLVITPLTDRCYITLAQALGMNMGGAPVGPAGTGKTETIKDMGRCLGKYVVVFNCSDQMDFRGLGRIFKGLAQSGSWGCFDEFNRIDLPVLSVAAQQIAIVLRCKKERKKRFIFTDGDNVEMNPEFGIFLTMNPGYAGRQELPENLKINFRSVAMMVPDRQIIIRVKLASCGFIANVVLARKFFTLYKLCEEQLSKQVHYDFGLRNILSVLRTLGAAKRANPTDTESTIVMRVLRDMNLSKLIDEDEPLFLSLIEDLFPDIHLDKAGYPELEAAIDKQVEEAGLVCHPPWKLKVIQLFETQRVRHGLMTLGPSGAGKTTCIHTLLKAMTGNYKTEDFICRTEDISDTCKGIVDHSSWWDILFRKCKGS
ncbi:hypothetical protein BTVI_152782 [Pitangus sulphuratus]|nr:hypothetical protein BTVI_152782 [Pitangus sulphuratus]